MNPKIKDLIGVRKYVLVSGWGPVISGLEPAFTKSIWFIIMEWKITETGFEP